MKTERASWTSDTALFLKMFARHGKQVASFAPSSRSLARASAEKVSREHPQTILELGAGTGAVTGQIVRRMHPESTLLAVELEPEFAKVTAARYPRATVVQGSAGDAARHLWDAGLRHVDVVVSGLPFPSLPANVCRQVLESYREFARGEAWFSQLTVMPFVYMPLYKRLFHEVHFKPAMLNLPPGGAYHCRGLRADFLNYLPNQEEMIGELQLG